MSSVLSLVVVGLLFAASCGGPPRQSRASTSALLVLECNLRDAELWLDSKYFREVAEAERGVRLTAGPHRLEVRHPDYHSMFYELELAPQQRKVLKVELAPRLR